MSGSINKHGNFTPGEGHNFSQRYRRHHKGSGRSCGEPGSLRSRRAPPAPLRSARLEAGWLRARPGLPPIKDLPAAPAETETQPRPRRRRRQPPSLRAGAIGRSPGARRAPCAPSALTFPKSKALSASALLSSFCDKAARPTQWASRTHAPIFRFLEVVFDSLGRGKPIVSVHLETDTFLMSRFGARSWETRY